MPSLYKIYASALAERFRKEEESKEILIEKSNRV